MTATAFVLAAGFGTRLQPLTLVRPKPLVPVCGVPALSYSLALCARHGLRNVVVNAHYLAPQVEAWAGSHEGVDVTVSTELPDILGTGGGLKKVDADLAQRFVVLNADVLHCVDLTELLAAVPPGGGAMALRPDEVNAPRYGVVAEDEAHRVVQLTSLATAAATGAVRRDTHFTGIHALDRAALDLVPEGFACIVRSAYVQMVPRRNVGAIRYSGPWLDAGDPAAYLACNLDVLHERVTLALDPFARAAVYRRIGGDARGGLDGVHLQGPVWIGPDASVGAGSTVTSTVIGQGASVAANTHLVDCVVWDGVQVPSGRHHGKVFYRDEAPWSAST